MIDVVGPWNRALHQSTLESMYRLRHQVFIEELGWDLPMAADGLEQDQFDGPRTVYLICRDEQDEITGSMRLIPSTEPHVLGDVFPNLCNGPVPRGPAIFESSRSCVSAKARRVTDLQGRIWGELMCGMIEYAMLRELETVTAVMEARMYEMARAATWPIHLLGERADIAGTPVVGVAIDVATRVLNIIRGRRRDVPDPALSLSFATARRAA